VTWSSIFSNWKVTATQVGLMVRGKATLADLARAWTRGADLDGPAAAGLHQAYAQSTWVMSGIQHVAQPLKAVPLKFYQGDKEVEDSKLRDFWKQPVKGMALEDFVEASAGWYILEGEFFWLLDESWMGRRGTRGRLILARPGDMRELVRGGVLLGWVWTDAGGRQHGFLPEDVIHKKTWNPYNHWRGLGRVQAAKIAAESDLLAGKFARDTYRNAGEMGDYIVAKAGRPSPAQEEQVVQALREKRAARLRGDYRPILLSADLEPKSPTVQALDAAFIENRVNNREEIYIAIGVPPSMSQMVANYSIGASSDYYRLLFGTSMPIGVVLARAIDELTERISGRADLEAFFDFDEHPVMQAVRRERIDIAIKLFGVGQPMKDINDYLDLGMKPYPGWEIGYLPFSAGAPVGEAKDPEKDPDLAEPDAVQEMFRALRMPVEKITLVSNVRVTDKATDARAALWSDHQAKRKAAAKVFEVKFRKVLMTARAEVLAKIAKAKASEETKDIETKAKSADFLFDLTKFAGLLRSEIRKAAAATLQKAGEELFAEVGKDDAFSMPSARALSFLSERENRMTDAADEVFASIARGLQDGIEVGDTMDELADRIRGEFSGIEKHRAKTVAQTEVAVCYGVAREEAMEQAGVGYKEWLTSRNENVRATHRAVDGQVVALHEHFTVGGEQLAHPGDPKGSAGNVINCHCIQIAAAKPKES
jgi:SPP1 gp7 family putative phage head morphogenesis protein